MTLLLGFLSARASPLGGLGTVPYSLAANSHNPATAAWFTRWRLEGTGVLEGETRWLSFGLPKLSLALKTQNWEQVSGGEAALASSRGNFAGGVGASLEKGDSSLELSLSGGLAAQGRVPGFGRVAAGVSLLGALAQPVWEAQFSAVTGYSVPFVLFLKFSKPWEGKDWEPGGGVDLSFALTSFLDLSLRGGYDGELVFGGGLALPFAAFDASWSESQTLFTISFYNPWAF